MTEHEFEKTADSKRGVIWTCARCGLLVLFNRTWPFEREMTYLTRSAVVADAEPGCGIDRVRDLVRAHRLDCDVQAVRSVQDS